MGKQKTIPGNKEQIEKYLDHRKLGKPILNKRKKPISESTERKIRLWLTKISGWLNQPFESVTEQDVDVFRTGLKCDKFKQRNGKPYSSMTKMDIEYKILRPFFQWLGKNELVDYVNLYEEDSEIPTLKKDEIESMLNATILRNKVILTILYDAGFRIGEALSIKYSDVLDSERKAKGFYMIRCNASKTKKRTVGLYMDFSTDVMDAWLRENKQLICTDAPLIPLRYENLRKILMRLGEKVLQKKIYPHLLRHSSATYYCHKLNHYQLCKRYGWAMASKMPQIYIDREGVGEKEVSDQLMEGQALSYRKETNQLKEENRLLKQRLGSFEKQLNKMSEIYSLLDSAQKQLKDIRG